MLDDLALLFNRSKKLLNGILCFVKDLVERLLLAAVLSGLAAWALSTWIAWPLDLLGRLLQVGLSSALGLLLFVGIGRSLGVPEVEELTATFTRRFSRR